MRGPQRNADEDLVISPLVVIPLARSKLLTQPLLAYRGWVFPLTPREGDFFDQRRQLRFSHYFLYFGSSAGAGRET